MKMTAMNTIFSTNIIGDNDFTKALANTDKMIITKIKMK